MYHKKPKNDLARLLPNASNDTLRLNGAFRGDLDILTLNGENTSPSLASEAQGRTKRVEREHAEQVLLFGLLHAHSGEYPDLLKAFAIPNGGARNIVVAGKLKAEGVRAGSPDIFFPLAKGGFFGMFAEMKIGRNQLTTEQRDRFNQLSADGYLCVVQWSADAMLKSMIAYVKGEITR